MLLFFIHVMYMRKLRNLGAKVLIILQICKFLFYTLVITTPSCLFLVRLALIRDHIGAYMHSSLVDSNSV